MPSDLRYATQALVATLALILVAASCGDDGDPAADDSQPTVLVTTSIWADVVANLACGDLVTVETLVPLGGDPHAFEPSLADRGRMDAAALVVANGLGLEEGLEDTIDAAEAAGTPVFRFGDHVDTIGYGADAEAGADGVDPHVWFDPVRVRGTLPVLAGRLVADIGLDAGAVDTCLRDYDEALAAVDADITGLVAALPEESRKLVTSHDSLGYFADRYGFELIGTVIPAPSGLAETNPAQLEALAELIERTGVGAVFAESQHSTADVDALAARVGDIEVVTLFTGTLGDGDSGATNYVDFMRTNAVMITDALS